MDAQDPKQSANTPRQDKHEEQDDYQAASQATSDYNYADILPPDLHPERTKRRHRVGLTLLVLLIVAVGGCSAYLLIFRSKPTNQPQAHSSQNQSSEAPKKITVTTKHFSSNMFSLDFDYPSDWTVAEPEGGNQIVATSPVMQLKAADGQQATAEVVLKVNQQGQDLKMFDGGNALAVRESKKVAYTKPTSTQRANTYLSFLQFASTSTNSALDAVYITGDFGYQTNQAIPKVDIAKVDPQVSISFVKCANTACSGTTTPLGIASTAWDDASFSGPLEAMLKSLVIR